MKAVFVFCEPVSIAAKIKLVGFIEEHITSWGTQFLITRSEWELQGCE